MDKEKKNHAQSGESGANELLRQLRAQYDNEDASDEVIDRPSDVFEGVDAFETSDEEDEVTRRIMEMFSAVEGQGATTASDPQQERSLDEDLFDETEALSEGTSAEPQDIEIEAEEDARESVHDFEDEVSAPMLPDDGGASEELIFSEPAPEQEVPQERMAEDAEKTVPTPLAAQEPAAQVPVEELDGLDSAVTQAQEEQDTEAMVEEPTEQPEAAEQSEITDTPQEIRDEPSEQTTVTEESEEQEQDAPASMELREDEVLLDEFEELPPSAEQTVAAPTEEVTPPQPKPIGESLDEADRPKQVTPRPSPLDAALSAQRKKHEAERSKHSAELRAAEALSEDDMLLLLRMGYENELRAQCAPKAVQQAEKERNEKLLTEKQKARLAFGCRDTARSEWEDASQKGDYFAREYAKTNENYRKDAVTMVWRLVFTVLFTVCTLAVDLLPLYSNYLPSPWVGIAQGAQAHLLGLQLLVLCSVPSMRRLLFGLRQLLRLSPEPISVVLPALIFNVFYDIVMALQGTQYALLNFPTALLLLLCVVGESMDLRRERLAYSMVASAENKVVLQEVEPRKKKVVRGGEVVKIINDDADRTHYRVTRAEHIDDYFYRTNAPTRRYRDILPIMALQCLLALGITGVSALRFGVDLQLLSVLMLTLQLCTPAVYALSFALSLLLACKRLSTRGITILGQSTVDEMAEEKMLIFDDTEMLQAKSSTEITVKGNGDPKKYVRYARRLFYALGGTLGKINTSDLSEDRMDGLVEILRVHADGVEARLDGRVRALLGSSAFMVRNNIRVPNAGAEMAARKNEQSSILYLAFGGQIRLGYEINYSIHGSFEQTVAALCRGKSTVAILSQDPCITQEYLTQGRSAKKAPVRVIKPVRHEPRRVLPRVSSGIVALKNTRALADAVRACEQMPLNDRACAAVQWTTSLASALCVAVLVFASVENSLLSVIGALLISVFALPIRLLCGRGLAQGEEQSKATDAPERVNTDDKKQK